MSMRSPPRLAWWLVCGATFGNTFCLRAAESASTTTATDSKAVAARPVSSVAIFDGLCRALRDNYPMLEYAGWREEQWTNEFRARIAEAPSPEGAFELMDEFVCRLSDYHTRLSWPGKPSLASPPFRVEPVVSGTAAPADHGVWGRVHPPLDLPALDGVAIAVVDASTNCELRVGDEILEVDGLPVGQALTQAWKHSVCSSVAGRLRSAAGRMLLGPADRELALKVQRHGSPGEEGTLDLVVSRKSLPAGRIISCREIENVPVIRITRWAKRRDDDLVSQFDELLSRYRDRPGLIIDVRGNGGGEDDLAGEVAGRFLAEPVIASISLRRQVPDLVFERTIYWVKPRGPWRYEGRVAVLTDEGCMSATEHFVSTMAEAGALLCGTPTSGACGLIRRVELPGGASLNVSRTFPLHTGGIPSPQLGIAPHLWAERTLRDLTAGQDTALKAALAWVRNKAALPTRFQPMSTFSGSR